MIDFKSLALKRVLEEFDLDDNDLEIIGRIYNLESDSRVGDVFMSVHEECSECGVDHPDCFNFDVFGKSNLSVSDLGLVLRENGLNDFQFVDGQFYSFKRNDKEFIIGLGEN